MAEDPINFSITVPITAPFEEFEQPGEVKLHDGDLTFVKLRPGTFSRRDSLSYGGHSTSLHNDMLRIKNVMVIGTDIIATLANLRSHTVSVRKCASWLDNMMGPSYGIIILKDFLGGSNLPTSGDSFDHMSDKIIFIPVPQSFSRFVVLDHHIVVSNKDYFATYNRHDGKLGYTNYVKPSGSPKRSNKVFHPPQLTADGFFMGVSFFKTTWEHKWFDHPDGQMVETDWTIKRYKVEDNGDITPVSTVLSLSCHLASEKLKDELTFVWSDELVYPSISRTEGPVTILLKSYCNNVINKKGDVPVLQEFKLPDELKINHRTAIIEEVKEFPNCLSFHLSNDGLGGDEKLIIIDKDSRSVARWFDISGMEGYDKHTITNKKIFIGLALSNVDFTDSEENKGLDYEIVMTGISGGNLESVYKGEGLNFATDFMTDNLLVIQKNFDEMSLLKI